MTRSDRANHTRLSRAAVDGVAAYLADEDADLHNITDNAVQADALTAALNLTTLAAAAVTALAAATGRTADEVLRSLRDGSPQPGPTERSSSGASAVEIVYPGSLDDFDWNMVEAKGWLEVTIRWAGGERVVTFFDPTRLAQTVQAELARKGRFADSPLVVVAAVTKETVESAVMAMAQHNFAELR